MIPGSSEVFSAEHACVTGDLLHTGESGGVRKLGATFGKFHNSKDYASLGFILGSACLWKPPGENLNSPCKSCKSHDEV